MTEPVIEILYAEAAPLSDDALYRFWMERMPEERKRRIRSLRHAESQRQSLGVGILLFQALRERGLDAQRADIQAGACGKPFLPEHPEIQFSLSHSGEWVMCAVGGLPVGCDVEKTGRGTGQLVRRFFHPEEQKALAASAGSEEWSEMFTRFWTRKESLLKAKGTGLTESLAGFSCLSPGKGIWYDDAGPGPGYAAACCALGEIRPVFRWRTVDLAGGLT